MIMQNTSNNHVLQSPVSVVEALLEQPEHVKDNQNKKQTPNLQHIQIQLVFRTYRLLELIWDVMTMK